MAAHCTPEVLPVVLPVVGLLPELDAPESRMLNVGVFIHVKLTTSLDLILNS